MVAMNEYRITLTPRAKDDLIDIGDYITFILLESDIARNYIKGLRNSISQLKFFHVNFHLFKMKFYKVKAFVVCRTKIIIFSMKS